MTGQGMMLFSAGYGENMSSELPQNFIKWYIGETYAYVVGLGMARFDSRLTYQDNSISAALNIQHPSYTRHVLIVSLGSNIINTAVTLAEKQ